MNTHCRRTCPVLLLAALVLGGLVSCQSVKTTYGRLTNAQPKAPEYTSSTTADTFRGVYDGTLNARPPQQPADATLILGKDSHLRVTGRGASRLILDTVEPRPPHVGQTVPSEALVFRAESAEPGAPAPHRVTVTPGDPRAPEALVAVEIDWGAGGGSHTGYVAQPSDISRGQGGRISYFKYADWRTTGEAAADPKAKMEETLRTLAGQENWRCLAGRNLTVRPGESASFRFDSGWTPRMYLFNCGEGAERLAIRVDKATQRFNVVPPRGPVNHPAIVGSSRSTGELNFRLREEDANAEPVTITILTLGNTLGDYGPLYPKEEAIADIAAPFVMAVGVGILLDQASGGPERRAADRAAAVNCRYCDGTGLITCTNYGCLNGSVNHGGFVSTCSTCFGAGKVTCKHAGL